MCSLRCYGTPDLRFGRVTFCLVSRDFGFCSLECRHSVLLRGTFGIVARDRSANAD